MPSGRSTVSRMSVANGCAEAFSAQSCATE
jgi:hypothetical protein